MTEDREDREGRESREEREDPEGRARRLLDRHEAFRFLTEATDLLVDAPNYEEGLQRLTEKIQGRIAVGAAVYVIGPDGFLHLRAHSGDDNPSDEALPELIRADADHSVAHAVREESFLALRDGISEIVLAPGPEGWQAAPTSATTLVLPLEARGRTLGTLILDFGHEPEVLAEDDLFFTRELSRRVALALDSARLLREAREAGQARVDFLSVMSHELRTPLTAIVGYADLMEAGISGPVNDRQQEQLGKIKSSAWNLQGLIDGILTFARFEAEEGELAVESVDVEDLVREALLGERAALDEKDLDVVIEVEEGIPPLPTDRRKMVRIVTQMLSNAVKFTREGRVRVVVSTQEDTLRIRVEDTGVGLASEHLESVFEPFWQAERAATRTAGGTGLGLSLARRLARLLDGEIEVESEPGRGSAFTLVLPLEGPGPDLP